MHDDGTEADAGRGDCGIADAVAFVAEMVREVNKQDRVVDNGSDKNHKTQHGQHVEWLRLESVQQSETTRDGWIKFGESSLGLGTRETISRAIKPTEGTCVFFPSFFWHGTNSFTALEPRLTVPMDIEPVG